mmetsp:Transcript_3153/g.9201  ORF Transcript_3153/g.9201 Transcript_3153/m.9201 type:complete len:317 (-) Transcript_3153:42-992(-)
MASSNSCFAAHTRERARRAAASQRLLPLAWDLATLASAISAAFLVSPRSMSACTKQSTALPSSLAMPALWQTMRASSATWPAWRGRSFNKCSFATMHRAAASHLWCLSSRAAASDDFAAERLSSKAWSSAWAAATANQAFAAPFLSRTCSKTSTAALASRRASSKKSRHMCDFTHDSSAAASNLLSPMARRSSNASANCFSASSCRCFAWCTSAMARSIAASPRLSPAAFQRSISALASSNACSGLSCNLYALKSSLRASCSPLLSPTLLNSPNASDASRAASPASSASSSSSAADTSTAASLEVGFWAASSESAL